jgi:hypothetical protein
MTTTQENKIRMYEAVSAVLAEHAERVRAVRAFPPAVEQFNTAIAQIRTQDRRTQEAATGKTAAKDSAEKSLIAILYQVSSALTSLAHRSGDAELSAKVKISKSEFQRKSQPELEAIAKVLHGIAVAHQQQLAEFGIDAALLAALDAAIAAFNEAIGKKEGGLAERSAAVQALKTLFSNTDQLLRSGGTVRAGCVM